MASKLSHERLTELLDYDALTGVFTWKRPTSNRVRVGSIAGAVCSESGYVRIRVDGELFHAHRLALFFCNGCWPLEVDHRNRVRSDNRLKNLREVTHAGNMHNMPMLRTNTSGTTGVYWDKNTSRWRAAIGVNGKQLSLGYHTRYSSAVIARKNGEVLWHQN